MDHINISELTPQLVVEESFILKSHVIKQTRNGSEYMAVELQDKTGSIKGNMWDASEDLADMLTDGGFVRAKISTEVYNSMLQCKVLSIVEIEPTEEDYAGLVPMVRESIKSLTDELMTYVNSVGEPYRSMLHEIMSRDLKAFTTMPAAKSMHHAEIGGLLMHTIEMLRMEKGSIVPIMSAKATAQGLNPVNEDLLTTATILHDWGKLREFSTSEIGLVTDYTPEGNLLGHITMGVIDIDPVARKYGLDDEHRMLLEHCILAHHGEKEYGSPVTPMTLEALILHSVDELSARTEQYVDLASKLDPGTFSQGSYSNGRIYRPLD